ncbi:MAG TPA: CehA/McbA family metallohydrolase, partial [Candidatus Solibacter sp.]|nr:CehA/McbA family metallohydrolase [Candidatus Solibacter sp.]
RELAANASELSFQLERWIDPSKFGYYSADHHIHAAGCSHYMNPTEGVQPEDMMRQILGEHMSIASVLTWGPDYYYQKQFFSGKDHPLSKPAHLMHYDLEVSGFPSSHAGHIVLLNLKDQDYPGTKKIEDWPTWDLPIFRWAKQQGAIVGFAHSGHGLAVSSKELPSYEMPSFDSIGANEYIVDVTHPNAVDFISAGDTPYTWELNIWYHTLNVGFRTRIAGETDFPCIYDGRVGMGRTYAKLDGLTYTGWLAGLQAGRSYVSDGKTHLMDLKVNGVAAGGDVKLNGASNVTVTLTAASYLPVKPNEAIRGLRVDQKPHWDVERARIGDTRDVPVEIVVNGKAVARQTLTADGKLHELKFEVPVKESSWIAARVLPSSHTNPVFALVGGKPVRASRASAEWCLNAVNQCWTQKAPRISAAELPAARQAYDHAREVYRQLIRESQ